MTVLGKRIIVKEDSIPNKMGHLYLPQSVKPTTAMLPHTGVVMGVGVHCDYPDIKVGARVLMNRLAPMDFMDVGTDKCLVMQQDDIMAVIE